MSEGSGVRAVWEAERAIVVGRETAIRAGATVRPLHLTWMTIDPRTVLDAERCDPFWRRPVPPRLVRPVVPVPPVAPAGPDGRVLLARRWWLNRFDPFRGLVLQELFVAPAQPGGDVHSDMAHFDEEVRGWALLAIADAGYDPSACRASTRMTEWWDVPAAERVGVEWAPNALPEPDPVFAALDVVEFTQHSANLADRNRVVAALDAWRAALAVEGRPTAYDTPYQRGFLTDLARKLDVAETTAKTLVISADLMRERLPACWARFTDGLVPWRGMQRLHAAIEGLDDGLLDEFDRAAAPKLGTIAVTGLKDALHRVREHLRPETKDDRHERARTSRRVVVDPAPDGMAWLHALLPAHEVLALDRQLTKAAIATHGRDAETRTVGQLRADVLRDAVTILLRTDATGQDLLVPGRRGVEAKVAILIPAMTALGHATAPPVLQGYGPIGIRTALRLAGDAKSWTRVLTDPLTGAIRTIGRDKYRPTRHMRAWIALLDGGSRGPGTIRRPDESDIDHVRSYNQDDQHGETGIDNLVLLSRRDHGGKTAGDADAHLLPDRTLVWTTTRNQTHVTRPHDPPEPTPIPPDLLHPDDCPF